VEPRKEEEEEEEEEEEVGIKAEKMYRKFFIVRIKIHSSTLCLF
jgi:hypothetical protein